MAGYIGANTSSVNNNQNAAERRKKFTFTTNTTVLSGLNFAPKKIHIFHNGIRLVRTTDYTEASDGKSVTLVNAAQAGDEVVAVTFAQAPASYSDADVDAHLLEAGVTLDATNDRVGIGTTAPTNQLTITDGTATPYGAEDEVLLDIKRATTNTAANKATAIRLGNNSNGARLSYGGASDTMNIIMGSGNITATFRNDGGMTLPYQPVFQAYGLNSGATGNLLTFVNTRINVGNHYSTSNGKFTVPVAGTYLFGWTNIANTANTVYRYYIYKNGSSIGDTHFRVDNSATGSEYGTNGMYTFPLSCSVNDYLQIYYAADDGTTATYTGADYPQFWGYLVA